MFRIIASLAAVLLVSSPALAQNTPVAIGPSGGGGGGGSFTTICPAPVASGQILYDNAGVCGGITGWTTNGTTQLIAGTNALIQFGGGSTIISDGTNIVAQRNGVNAQTARWYGTFTDASNYERLEVVMAAGATTFQQTQAGTGTARGLQIGTVGNSDLTLFSQNINRWKIPGSTGHLLAVTDNMYDIGASGATRPRTLYLGTTDAGTSTTGALVVAGGGSVAKRFWLPAITASAGLQTAVLCQSSGGEVIADSVACLASSARFKNIAGAMEDGALAKLAVLPMHRWSYKPEGIFHNDAEHVGPIAEDVAAMDARLAGYDSDGKVRTYSTEQLLAYTIKAVQELKADNDNLRQELRYRGAIAR